jgi:hypothetical protein
VGRRVWWPGQLARALPPGEVAAGLRVDAYTGTGAVREPATALTSHRVRWPAGSGGSPATAVPWARGREGGTLAGYSGTPLARKLGIAAGSAVLLDGAPADFAIDGLPDGVVPARRTGNGPYDVILLFCPDQARLVRRWPVLHPLTTPAGSLWVAWPKRSSGRRTDLDENVVREYALAHGRVDVKVCAVDDTWSGLKHVIRKADRPG